MAKKPQSFRLIDKTHKNGRVEKTIVLYTNIRIEAETDLINFYLDRGYQPKYEEKKAGVSVATMRKELAVDEKKLAEFNEKYNDKDNKNSFFDACKVYTEWKKANK